MKNILIVSENFTKGGLETQIYTMYQESLKNKKASFIFSFGNYNEEWNFPKDITYCGFNYKYNCTVKEFTSDVERLLKIIKKHNIDVIHVHPFFSVFPAVVASQIAQVPIIYTYHGYVSMNFPFNFTCQYLLEYSFDEIFNHIFFVYNNIAKYMNGKFRIPNCSFLPNPIDLNKYKLANCNKNGKWAYSCRISSDKINGIEMIINNLDNFNISELHIYGDGDKKEYLEKYIKRKKYDKMIILHDFSNNISEELSGNYNGLFAMGRSALEGIALGLPVCIVGYGKIYGIVNKNNIDEIIDNNFAPIFLSEPSREVIKEQFKIISEKGYKCDFYNKIENIVNVEKVFEKYLKEIEPLTSISNNSIKVLFQELKKLDNMEEFIYTADNISELVVRILNRESINFGLNRFVITDRKIKELDMKLIKDSKDNQILTNRIEEIIKQNNELKESINELTDRMNNVNIKNIFINTIKVFIKKIRRIIK